MAAVLTHSPATHSHSSHDSPFSSYTTADLFLRASSAQLGKSVNVDEAVAVLTENWVETVRDLRLLVLEDELKSLRLHPDLEGWIKLQCAKNFDKNDERHVAMIELVLKEVLDKNGLFFYLGTLQGKERWKNPAKRGLVKVSSSSLMGDSAPLEDILDQKLCRIVTKPLENSWMRISLVAHQIRPTSYTLRHYSSWDTEALRSWKLEASVDGDDWEIIRLHKNDRSLDKKGACKAWSLQCDKFYSHFRIWQTGQNSNRHYYLSCCGVEFYGTLRPRPQLPNLQKKTRFEYERDFDTNGIIWYIGSKGGTQRFQNPAKLKLIDVRCSQPAQKTDVNAVVGRETVRCVTTPQEKSWFLIDLKNYSVNPTHYTLRHYKTYDTEALRNWHLEGSNDGISWEKLLTHKGDESLNKAGATKTWRIPRQSKSFSQFRIFQYGQNSNAHHYLACSGFEIYGNLSDSVDILAQNVGRLRLDADEVKEDTVHRKKRAAKNSLDASSVAGAGAAAVAAGHFVNVPFRPSGDPIGTSGLLYYLGTNGGTEPWVNPVDRKMVYTNASSRMEDSVDMKALCGRETVRCVTRPEKNSYISISLANGVQIRPTHYSLRHYSSWDTEALRNWDFRASKDGKSWKKLFEHRNDVHLEKRGSTHTWEVRATDYYSHFMIFQTGTNSNNHYYLSCSGMELFGDALVPRPQPNPLKNSPAVKAARGPRRALSFKHSSDFDENGILYYLGTQGKTRDWTNPAELGAVDVTSSTLMNDSVPISAVVGRKVVRCVTLPAKGVWVNIRFKNHFVRPTHYTLRHYITWNTEALRSWRLMASNDANNWVVLREHAGDESLDRKGASHTWKLDTLRYYSHFRLEQTGPNSNNHLYMAISGFEIYGSVLTIDPDLHFCSNVRSENVRVDDDTSSAVNVGTEHAWQSALSRELLKASDSDFHHFDMLVLTSPKTSNSWTMIMGVAPQSFTCSGSKQWIGSQKSWGFVAGTGGKVFDIGRCIQYGKAWGQPGDLIGCSIDFRGNCVEFFLNGVSQGLAFRNFKPSKDAVRAGISFTAKAASVAFVRRLDTPDLASERAVLQPPQQAGADHVPAALAAAVTQEWDGARLSPHMALNVDGTVYNKGSNDTWQIALSKDMFKSGRVRFHVDLVRDESTSNNWKFIVGVVPHDFDIHASCWIGFNGSWGYIGATGGKVHKVGKSIVYGQKYAGGDRISVQLDFNKRTIEFFKNDQSQGIAFENLRGSVRAAVSITGTNSSARLVL